MLIAAGKDFDAKYKPETVEEAVDQAVADGTLSLKPGAGGEGAAEENDSEDPLVDTEDPWAAEDSIALQAQRQTAIYFNKQGELVIAQRAWPDDDVFIYIGKHSIEAFLDRLCDVAGVQSVGGSQP